MKDSYKVILKDFFPRYVDILTRYKNIIDNVVIVGHTAIEDKSGNNETEIYEKNLLLSQKRADKVLEFIKNIDSETILKNKNWIERTFFAEGLSYSEPLLKKEGSMDNELSRRVELVILFNENFDKTYKSRPKSENKNIPSKIFFEVPRAVKLNKDKNAASKKLTLRKYINELLVKNPTLNEQYFLLKSLEQDIEISKAAFRPTVTLNFAKTEYTQSLEEKTRTESKDITVKYNLFNGFKDEKELKINEYNYLGKRYKKEQLEVDLIYSLIESYLNLNKVNEVYELSRENYGDYIRWEERSKIKFQNGLLSLKDYSKIQARSINRYINFEEDTKRFNDGISTVQKYIDFNDEDIKYLQNPDPKSKYFDDYKLALEECKIYSPFIKEAKQNIDLYKEKLNKAKVNFYPVIDLIGKKSTLDEHYRSYIDESDDTSLAFQASLELYSGGKDKADEQKKFYEYKQKIQKKKEVVRDVIYKVDLAINNYNSLALKHEFFKDLVTKREEEYIAANYDFKFAKISENDLLDIMDSLYNAKRQFIENRYDFTASKYKLLKEIGILKEYILK